MDVTQNQLRRLQILQTERQFYRDVSNDPDNFSATIDLCISRIAQLNLEINRLLSTTNTIHYTNP